MKTYDSTGEMESRLDGRGEYIKKEDAVWALSVVMLRLQFNTTDTSAVINEFEEMINK